jgi:4-hydroxy-2-oxoheptanedioate aldolase
MNERERRMVEQLQDLRENHHVTGVKAEFEAEGTRLEEAMRLKEVVSAAGLGLTVKVGGCEALRDMYDARIIGVERMVGPMIESPWACHKFVAALQMAYPEAEREHVQFCVNIETVTGVQNFDAMLALPDMRDIDGIVLGRIDMCGSLGLTREDVNQQQLLDIALELFRKAKAHGLECAIGGGVGKEALDFMRQIPSELLDRYETRKVVFACPEGLDEHAEAGILKAVGFELMWLKNKRDFYGAIFDEDRTRIDMLQSRYDHLIEEAGGQYR